MRVPNESVEQEIARLRKQRKACITLARRSWKKSWSTGHRANDPSSRHLFYQYSDRAEALSIGIMELQHASMRGPLTKKQQKRKQALTEELHDKKSLAWRRVYGLHPGPARKRPRKHLTRGIHDES